MIKILKNDKLIKIGQCTLVLFITFLFSGASIKELSNSNEEKQIAKYASTDTTQNNVLKTNINGEESLENIEAFLITNKEQLLFYSKMFDMDYNAVEGKIREINPEENKIVANNIGLIKDADGNIKQYDNVDRGILELFLYLEENYPEMITKSHRPSNVKAEYIEALVEYFSYVYGNVDHHVMLSIGAAESGYYTAKTMLSKNNVYGGMGSSGLISYSNIEYGVMSYIKKMSESYYDKGLNTIESIGYVFCPRMENGVKTVSSHWIKLVNKAMDQYTHEIRYVSVAQLNDLINNEI